VANFAHGKVLLTGAEAAQLRKSGWEVRAQSAAIDS